MGKLGPREPDPPNGYDQGRSGQSQKLASPQLTPSEYWNEGTRNRWFNRCNLGTAILDGMETTCLIDNGAQVNLVTPEFVWDRGLDVGSIQDLNQHNWVHSTKQIGGKGYGALRLRDAPGPDTVRAEFMTKTRWCWWCQKIVIFSGNARLCWEHQ